MTRTGEHDGLLRDVLTACGRLAEARFETDIDAPRPLHDALSDSGRGSVERASALLGGEEACGDGLCHGVIVFGMVARTARERLRQSRAAANWRARRDDEAFDAFLQRCQIGVEVPFPGDAARARGRALGTVLEHLRAGGVAPEAMAAVAGEAFCSESLSAQPDGRGSDSMLDMLGGAVEAEAGAPVAVMGFLSCLIHGIPGERGWKPQELAWVISGLWLRLAPGLHGFVSGNEAWEDDCYDELREGVVASARKWSGEEASAFKRTLRVADAAVAAFNAEVQRPERGPRAWEGLDFLRQGVAPDLRGGVETLLSMKETARRLTTSGETETGDRPVRGRRRV